MTRPFSERVGANPARTVFQTNVVEERLRVGLWNVLAETVFRGMDSLGQYATLPKITWIHVLCRALWRDHYHYAVDTLDQRWRITRGEIRDKFFNCKWFEVYDFIEFVVERAADLEPKLIPRMNNVLEREKSAYRIIGGLVTPITNETELTAIDEALESKNAPAQEHLRTALQLLSNRTSPDPRNSIKESISAVEAVVRQATGASKGTLGDLLKRMEDQHELDPALKAGFAKLYGYTSDKSGIRHALLDKDHVTIADAKYMLVTCSAFVNYVTEQHMPD